MAWHGMREERGRAALVLEYSSGVGERSLGIWIVVWGSLSRLPIGARDAKRRTKFAFYP